MLLFQAAGDFELDLLALAERAEEEEEEEKKAEEKRREEEELQDVLVAEEEVTANYPLLQDVLQQEDLPPAQLRAPSPNLHLQNVWQGLHQRRQPPEAPGGPPHSCSALLPSPVSRLWQEVCEEV